MGLTYPLSVVFYRQLRGKDPHNPLSRFPIEGFLEVNMEIH